MLDGIGTPDLFPLSARGEGTLTVNVTEKCRRGEVSQALNDQQSRLADAQEKLPEYFIEATTQNSPAYHQTAAKKQ